MKSAVLLLAGLFFVYALFCASLYLFQRSFMYFPTPQRTDVAAEELSIESGEARLKIWRLHGERANAILYFGGNAEDVALNVPEFTAWFPGCAVYLVNYRGYGGSSGSPRDRKSVV